MSTQQRFPISDVTVVHLNESLDKDYKNVSVARNVRNNALRLHNLLSVESAYEGSVVTSISDKEVVECFTLNVEDSVQIQVTMASQKSSAITTSFSVRNPCTFNSFNRFLEKLQSSCSNVVLGQTLEKLFRETIGLIGNDFTYEVESDVNFFDFVMESKVHRHQVEIRVQLTELVPA